MCHRGVTVNGVLVLYVMTFSRRLQHLGRNLLHKIVYQWSLERSCILRLNHLVPLTQLDYLLLHLRALWRCVFLNYHRLGLLYNSFRDLQIHLRVVKCRLRSLQLFFIYDRWLVRAVWYFEFVVWLCKLIPLKQKAVIPVFWMPYFGWNLIWFWPSTCA